MAAKKKPARTTQRRRKSKVDAHTLWRRQVDKLKAAIKRIESVPSMHGAEWVTNQVAYFKKRLAALMEAEPPRE